MKLTGNRLYKFGKSIAPDNVCDNHFHAMGFIPLTGTFSLVRDPDKCPPDGPNFFVVATRPVVVIVNKKDIHHFQQFL